MFYLNATITLASNNSIRFVGSGHQNFGGARFWWNCTKKDVNNEFFNITNSRAIHFVGITFKGIAPNQNGGNTGMVVALVLLLLLQMLVVRVIIRELVFHQDKKLSQL